MSTNRASTGAHPDTTAGGDDNRAKEVPTPTVTSDSRAPNQSTNLAHPLPLLDNVPIQSITAVPQVLRLSGTSCLT